VVVQVVLDLEVKGKTDDEWNDGIEFRYSGRIRVFKSTYSENTLGFAVTSSSYPDRVVLHLRENELDDLITVLRFSQLKYFGKGGTDET
jgi:hypothetical protein